MNKIAVASLAVLTVIESVQLWPLWSSVSTRAAGSGDPGPGDLRSVTHFDGRGQRSQYESMHAVPPPQKGKHEAYPSSVQAVY